MNEIILSDKRKMSNVQNAILYFFIYSFLGWSLEVVYAMYVHRTFVNRGFLFGPICPIYGFGALILIGSLRNVKKNRILKFFIAIIAFSVFEYIASYILEVLFNQRWWDYSNDILNLQGRISILYSLVWGILGILFTEKLHPFIRRKVEEVSLSISKKTQTIIIYTLVVIFVMDEIFSILAHLK
ncbi:MAG: putative ABC transporter permease [Clostridia bacterium]|nr:putative ABC transporter permease [Clostridia bacterium]